MKVTLQIDGKKRTFSNVENISIEEEKVKSSTEDKNYEVAQKPTEDEWFEVKPQAINQKLFEKKRKDTRQEATRQLILEAFAEMKNNPKKYGRNFKTMMPKKDWSSKIVAQLKEMAYKLGDHNADWVEQALEWAQRIANGESWEDICNKPDTANWYRLVVWKNGYARLVGGSVANSYNYPASDVGNYDCYDYYILYDTVPLVVLYEK